MTLKEKAYAIIKERIINCVYAPGTVLNEKQIIAEIGVSRTPFREAATALKQEGFVQIVPRKGMYVSPITLKDISNLYEIREVLEPKALELAMERIPADILKEYYGNMKALQKVDNSMEEKEDLHKLILKYVDNALLEQMLNDLYTSNHRLSFLCGRDAQNLLVTKGQHLRIAKRMVSGDKQAAMDAMVYHIKSSKERAMRYLHEQEGKLNIVL
ncbi:MAG TPA: hypothetical protein DEB31_08410 [Clostridiales bacterium]|nr:hypothetical protein [Clostridiales bacterium]